MHLDVAGRQFWVSRVLCAAYNPAHDGNHVFIAQFLCSRVCLSTVIGIENYLSDTGTIAKIDKRELAEVATLRDPAHQHHLLTDISSAKITAGMRAFQVSEIVQHSVNYPCAISRRLPPGSRT